VGVDNSGAAGVPTENSGNIDITADAMTVVTETHHAIATGHVHARGKTFEAFCDHGEVTYGEAYHGKRSIQVLVMTDHVKLHRFTDGLVAESALATYHASTHELVLTGGDPVATRGPDVLHGNEITVTLDTNAIHVVEPRSLMIRSMSTRKS
jgi:lipopolysaccharide export system protein LptA